MPSMYSAVSHEFVAADPAASRSPCPALNALANQGYIPREGTEITFMGLVGALRHVYNLSLPLALLLTSAGFLTSGSISFHSIFHEDLHHQSLVASLKHLFAHIFVLPRWTLDLASLSARGATKIAHDASLVHPDAVPSTTPDPELVTQLLRYAQNHQTRDGEKGMSLLDFAQFHKKREALLQHPLSWLHEQTALGEYGLAWSLMRNRRAFGLQPGGDTKQGEAEQGQDVIPVRRLEQWFGEERLPSGWWNGGVRPPSEIGLFEARRRAKEVEANMSLHMH